MLLNIKASVVRKRQLKRDLTEQKRKGKFMYQCMQQIDFFPKKADLTSLHNKFCCRGSSEKIHRISRERCGLRQDSQALCLFSIKQAYGLASRGVLRDIFLKDSKEGVETWQQRCSNIRIQTQMSTNTDAPGQWSPHVVQCWISEE